MFFWIVYLIRCWKLILRAQSVAATASGNVSHEIKRYLLKVTFMFHKWGNIYLFEENSNHEEERHVYPSDWSWTLERKHKVSTKSVAWPEATDASFSSVTQRSSFLLSPRTFLQTSVPLEPLLFLVWVDSEILPYMLQTAEAWECILFLSKRSIYFS